MNSPSTASTPGNGNPTLPYPNPEQERRKKKEERVYDQRACSTTCSTTRVDNKTSFVTSIVVWGRKFSLRIPVEKWGDWQRFKELVERENVSISELITKAMEEYVAHHHPGNPQRPLDLFLHDFDKPLTEREMLSFQKQGREAIAKALDELSFALKHLNEIPEHNLPHFLRIAEEYRFLPLAQEFVTRVKARQRGP